MNEDQWLGFWQFCRMVSASFEGYDPDGACYTRLAMSDAKGPSMIDDFVSYCKSQM